MITITEALAEIKTVQKRITSKQEFIASYLIRLENVKDPLEKDGGSQEALARELQAITDLEKRVVELRRGIQTANENTKVTIEEVEQSITDWLVWRREIAPNKIAFLRKMRQGLGAMREQARRQGSSLVPMGTTEIKTNDMIVNVDEKSLALSTEKLDKILGELDGQLSLKNATVQIA